MFYDIKGKYKEKDNFKPFTRKIEAASEKRASEKIMTLFGSEHKIKRRHIMIENITESEVSLDGRKWSKA